MGWFDKGDNIHGLRPLTQERLTKIFDTQGWHYGIDDDGDLGGRWDGAGFYFFTAGAQKEILHISSAMAESVPTEREDELLNLLEDWNRDRIWPKSYYMTTADGSLSVRAEVNVDYEQGVTDEQLLQHVSCALGTSLQLYTHIRDSLGIPQESQQQES